MNQFKKLFKSLSISRTSSTEFTCHSKQVFGSLPAEITYYILSLLGAPDLVILERVSKEMKYTASCEFVWKLQYDRRWKKLISSPKKGKIKGKGKEDKAAEVSYREMYKLKRKSESAWRNHEFNVTDLTAHQDDVICLQYIGDLLATGSGDGTVKLWDLKKKKCKVSLRHAIDVFCLQIDGDRLASGGGERHITLWDLTQAKIISKMPCKDTIKCLQILDSNLLICGSADGFIYQYDLRTKKHEKRFSTEIEDVWCLQAQGNTLVCGGVHPKNPLRVYDLRSEAPGLHMDGHTGLVSSLHFEDNTLVTGSSDSTVRVWDMTTGKSVQQFHTYSKVFCVYMYDSYVVYGCDNANAFMRDIKAGDQITSCNYHQDAVLCVQFDAQRMVTGSYDKTIRVWDLARS